MKFPPYSYIFTKKDNFSESFIDVDKNELPDSYCFFSSPDLSVKTVIAEDKDSWLLIAGLVVDLKHEIIDAEKICKNLYVLMNINIDQFLDKIDYLAGRWIILYKENRFSPIVALGDATNMLKINYLERGGAISSNIFLLNRSKLLIDNEYRDTYKTGKNLWKYGCLGNLSPFKNIKILTPNHSVNVDSGEIRRFYPRKKIQNNTVANVAEEIIHMADIQIRLLKTKYKLLNSITAGIDSRVSIALQKNNFYEQFYFTYFFKEDQRIDLLVANKIATTLNLNHYSLIDSSAKDLIGSDEILLKTKILEYQPSTEISKSIAAWDWYKHGGGLISAYTNLIQVLSKEAKVDTYLHIRSNLWEIGRCFWGKNHGQCNETSDILRKSRKDWFDNASDIFNHYFSETEINNDSVYGLDLLDIFYWEHRCGTWVSEVLQGTDFAFNTHSIINCRKMIELFLSVSFEERKKASVYYTIVNKNLPEIEKIPVNPKAFT